MGNSANNKKHLRKHKARSVVEPLEPRLLYSADVLNVIGGALLSHDNQDNTELAFNADLNLTATTSDTSIEIVFIDGLVPDYQKIVDDIANNSQGNVLVYVIDANSNGVEQIEDHLENHESVSAIHLIAHEQSDGIRLGNVNLTSDNTTQFTNSLSNWGNSLTESADILIYGCNLASSENGLEFVQTLANITGADVAASIDNTGGAALKANWELEHHVGSIEAHAPVSDSLKDDWQHILAAIEVSTTTDKFNTSYNYDSIAALIVSAAADTSDGEISLREAIIAANKNADLDIITLPAGVYNLSLEGFAENLSHSGDFDIEQDLIITGAGADETVINNTVQATAPATDVSRIFHIRDSDVQLNSLSIQGGESDASNQGGAGILVSDSSLELNFVDINNNHSGNSDGGGILSITSNITLNDSNIQLNTSDKQGGGIHADENTSVELNNSYITNNTAQEDGGGAYIEGSMSVNSSSINLNTSTAGSGGGVFASTMDSSVTFSDARIESNTAFAATGGGAFIAGATSINESNFFDNKALNGGGLFYENANQTLEINNTTFSSNTAVENGGAIQVDDVDLAIRNTTLAYNNAGKLGAAIDIEHDHGKSNTIENTIVAYNVSTNSDGEADGARQLDHEVTSNGFNLISGDHDNINYALGDINQAHGSNNVIVNLASELTSPNGSHSRHLALNAGSDAIDSGSGPAQTDANGIMSNEFVDIGATEYISTQDATKVFWIDATQEAVYRGNQDGSGVQKILDYSAVIGTPYFVDLDYDPITQRIFYGVIVEDTVNSYYIAVTDSDGRNYDSGAIGIPIVGLSTGYTIHAISVEQDKVYVAGYVYNFLNNYYISSFDISTLANGSIDMSNYGIFSGTAIELIPNASLLALETLDVSSTFGGIDSQPGAKFIAWGGDGSSPIFEYNFLYSDGSAAPNNFDVLFPALPSDETQGVTLDSSNNILYGVKDHAIFSIALDNSDTSNLTWDANTLIDEGYAEKFTDVAYDSANDIVWYSTESGLIGYTDPNLTNPNTEFNAGVTLPSAISLTTLSTVNHLPATVTGKPAFTINEGGELEITQAHLETTDEESANENIVYTIETNTTQGGLYHKSDLSTQISSFTQADLNSNDVLYKHSGDEPAAESFVFTVSDGVHTLGSQTFSITITQVNDTPTANKPSVTEALTEQTSFTYTIPDGAFSDAEGDALTYQVTLTNGDPLPAWLNFNNNKTLSGTPDDGAANASLENRTLHITATDPSGAVSAPMSLVLNITNINTPPSAISSTALSIDENTSGTVAIGNFSTTDLDAADTHEYTVNDTRFEFNNNVLELIDGNSLNHENDESITLSITSTDNGTGQLSRTQNFTLSINDLNENPVAAQSTIDHSTNELQPFSTTISDTLFSDEDETDTHLNISAHLADGTPTGTAIPASFWLQYNPTSKVLSGTPQDSDTGVTTILLTASDASGAQSTPVTVTITVNDVNQVPTFSIFPVNPIIENTAGAFVASVAASDADSADTISFTVDDARFVFNGNNLSLKPTSEFDYELENTVDVTLTVTDNNGASSSNTYSLLVVDANDAPVANAADSSVSATEQTQFLHEIDATAFTDADTGDAITINAYLDDGSATGTAIPATHWIQWNSTTREFSGLPQDSDTGDTKLLLIASDNHGAQSAPIKLTVSVGDINQAPNAPVLTHNAITENEAGALVGTVTATDPDAADQLSFSVNDQRFQIGLNAASQFELSLKPGSSINYEQEQSVAIQVSVADGNGGVKTSAYNIAIDDANDTPTLNTALISQNTDEAVAFAFDMPSDAFDDEDNDPLTLSVSQADGTELPNWLNFDATNNRLSGTPGDGNTGTLNLHVFAHDPDNTYSVASPLTINVANTNQAPTNISIDNNAINENSTDEVVGSISVSDPDVTDTHALSVNDERFQIVNSQLQLKPGVEIDFETEASTPTIPLEVTATDSAGIAISTSIDVAINDVNDLPIGPATLPLQTTNDAQHFSYRIPDGTFTDQDGDNITLSATLIDGSALPQWLSFDSSSNTFSGQASEADQGVIQIQINAFDGSANALAKTAIIVNVSNINQEPTDISLDKHTVVENELGALVGKLHSTDPDSGDTHHYTVDDIRFQIVDGQLSLKPFLSLNHELEPTVTIDITSTDNQGKSLTESLVLSVTDENDAPAINATLNDVEAHQDELLSITIPVDAFIDEDVENANSNSLSLVVSMSDDAALPDWLEFDQQNMLLSGTPSNADIAQLSIKVIAIDSLGAPSDPQHFEITVNNVNDTPVILALSNLTVTEEVYGATVGELSVNDVDTNATLTLAVDDDRFEFIGTQLVLKPDQKIDFETEPSISLSIRVEDEFAAASTRTFEIQTIEVNEAPVAQSDIENLDSQVNQVIDISSISFIDPDNEIVTLSVIGTNGEALPNWVKYDSEAQTIEFENPPDNLSTIDIIIVAEDERGSKVEHKLTIAVSDAPELSAAMEEITDPTTHDTTPVINQNNAATTTATNTTQKPEAEANTNERKEPVLNAALPELNNEVAPIDLAHLIKPLDIIEISDLEHESATFASKRTEISISQLDLDGTNEFQFDLQSAFDSAPTMKFYELASEFDRQKEKTEEALASDSKLVASSFTFTSGLSVGYILWLIRGGTLMGSVLSSLPAWRLVDPLPILGSLVDEYEEDDESLESLVEKKPPEDPDSHTKIREAA